MRVVIPGGRISSVRARALAALSEKYAAGLISFTTRQCAQFHRLQLREARGQKLKAQIRPGIEQQPAAGAVLHHGGGPAAAVARLGGVAGAPIAMALGPANDDMELRVPVSNFGMGSLVRHGAPDDTIHTVPVRRLSDIVAAAGIRSIRLIKIDVEGAELSVFKGALATFKAKPPVILMEADDNMARFNYTRADLLHLLREVSPGYRFQFVDEHTGALSPLANEDAALVSETRNFLALPPGRDVAHA
jgi:hypothetical protein